MSNCFDIGFARALRLAMDVAVFVRDDGINARALEDLLEGMPDAENTPRAYKTWKEANRAAIQLALGEEWWSIVCEADVNYVQDNA